MGTSDIHSAVHSQFDVRSPHVSQPPLLVFSVLVAVGTALASGPPHGSVREELPHTALTSGSCNGQPFVRTQLVVRATTSVTRFPGSVSGTSALVVRSPWPPSFPLRTPLPMLPRRLCSPASLVL